MAGAARRAPSRTPAPAPTQSERSETVVLTLKRIQAVVRRGGPNKPASPDGRCDLLFRAARPARPRLSLPALPRRRSAPTSWRLASRRRTAWACCWPSFTVEPTRVRLPRLLGMRDSIGGRTAGRLSATATERHSGKPLPVWQALQRPAAARHCAPLRSRGRAAAPPHADVLREFLVAAERLLALGPTCEALLLVSPAAGRTAAEPAGRGACRQARRAGSQRLASASACGGCLSGTE
jgi:hypothetical protein